MLPPVTPRDVMKLRAELVAFEANRRSSRDPLPEVANTLTGRLADISQPLLRVINYVKPSALEEVLGLLMTMDRNRRTEGADTPEGRVVLAVNRARENFQNGELLISDLEKVINEGLSEGDPEYLSRQRVGYLTRDLKLEKRKGKGGRRTVLWPGDETVAELVRRYDPNDGLGKPSNPSEHSAFQGTQPNSVDEGSLRGSKEVESHPDPSEARLSSPESENGGLEDLELKEGELVLAGEGVGC